MKKCFVIMPYGGNNPDRQKHYLGVYNGIIKPAVESYGYAVERSDITEKPGSIPHQIIRDLAEADLVIADLSEGNPNVFFELGVRHSFKKSGTIHIYNETDELSFDIAQYRAIPYSTNLADIQEIAEKISKAIAQREADTAKSDNPVHDAISGLPRSLLHVSEQSVMAEMANMQEQLNKISQDKQELEDRLAQIDPGAREAIGKSELDIMELLKEADEIEEYTSESLEIKLRNFVAGEQKDEFKVAVRDILQNPYLSADDFIAVGRAAAEFRLHEYERAVLEAAHMKYPTNKRIVLFLAQASAKSKSLMANERGRLLIEKQLNITHGDDGPIASLDVLEDHIEASLATLFEMYSADNRPNWKLSVVDSVSGLLGEQNVMLLRNRGRALHELGRLTEAEEAFKSALSVDPSDDATLTAYGVLLNTQRRFTDALILMERALEADPDDPTNYLNVAIQILNYSYVRATNGEITEIDRTAAKKYAVTIMRATALKFGHDPRAIMNVAELLSRNGHLNEAQILLSGKIFNVAEPPDVSMYFPGLESEAAVKQDVSSANGRIISDVIHDRE